MRTATTLALALAATAAGCGGAAAPAATAPPAASTPAPSIARRAAPPPERWCLHLADDGAGGMVTLVMNHGYEAFAGQRDYPWLVQVHVEIVDRNPQGLPTPAEADVLNALEERLTPALTAGADLHYVGRATMPGFRDLLYYAADGPQADAVLKKQAALRQARAFEYTVVEDPTWAQVAPVLAEPGDCAD